jgi:hypothetical protein
MHTYTELRNVVGFDEIFAKLNSFQYLELLKFCVFLLSSTKSYNFQTVSWLLIVILFS